MDENSQQERRQFKRVDLAVIVMYEVNSPLTVRMEGGEKDQIAKAFDISEGGMGLLVNDEIPTGSIIRVRFAMINFAAYNPEDQYKSMQLEGEVRYCTPVQEKYAYRVGLRFINISKNERTFISDFVKAISTRKEETE
ncbi:MAG: hypothetical protein DRP74_09260 [Candidatus Omnitrophota bacterium]|nr:MAG: hypothetical protein DRP74_09260 [Candidatus Omnitrophota bacterium]